MDLAFLMPEVINAGIAVRSGEIHRFPTTMGEFQE
jgi:hypothetical protein